MMTRWGLALALAGSTGCALILGLEDPSLLPGGGAGALDVDVEALHFGDRGITEGADVKPVVVANTGEGPLTVEVTIEGDGFSLVANPCGALAAGTSCSPEIGFDPAIGGPAIGVLHVRGPGQADIDVPLDGRGLTRVEIVIGGTAQGEVTFEELALTCSLSCSMDVPLASVTLTAVPAFDLSPPSHKGRIWGAPCAGEGPTCVLDLSAPRTVPIDFLAPYLYRQNGTGNGYDHPEAVAFQPVFSRVLTAGKLVQSSFTVGWLGYFGSDNSLGNQDSIGANGPLSVITDVEVDSDSFIAVAGAIQDGGNTQTDFWVRRTDTQGVPVFTLTYGAAATPERALGVAVGPSKEVVAVGEEFVAAGQCTNVVVRKYSSAGVLAWGKVVNLGNCDTANDVAIDAAGNVYVVGTIRDSGPPVTGSVFLLKYDADGNAAVGSPKLFTTANVYRLGDDILIDSDGTIYLAGGYYAVDGGGHIPKGWMAAVEPDLDVIWENQAVGTGELYSIQRTPDGRLSVTSALDLHTVNKDGTNPVRFGPTGGWTLSDHMYDGNGRLIIVGTVANDFAWARYFGWPR